MGLVVTFLFLFFGWIIFSAQLVNDGVKTNQATKRRNNWAEEKQKSMDQLYSQDLERQLKEKLFFGHELYEETIEKFNKRIQKIPGLKGCELATFHSKDKIEEVILLVEMSDRGKVPRYPLEYKIEFDQFSRMFVPALTQNQQIEFFRWYEDNLHNHGGWRADIRAYVSTLGEVGIWYFSGISMNSIIENGREKKLW